MGCKNIYTIMYKKFSHVSVKGITLGYLNSLQVFMNLCCVLCNVIAIACCKFQSKVSSRVSCTQMKTPIVFNKRKAWLVISFIHHLFQVSKYIAKCIFVNHGHFVFKLIICDIPLCPFFFFVLWKDEHELQKNLQHFNNECCFFFFFFF